MRLVILLLASLLPSLVAADSVNDKKALLDLEQRWLTAAQARDQAALAAILTDDFTDISWQGRVRGKADVLAAPATPRKTRQSLSELKVRVRGDVGIVTGLNTAEATDGSFRARVRFTDIFVREKDGWRAWSAQETVEQGG